MVKTVSNDRAVLIANLRSWREIILRAISNTSFFATNRNELEAKSPTGTQQGLSLVPADGIVHFPWIGYLYVVGSAPGTEFDIQIPEPTPEQTE